MTEEHVVYSGAKPTVSSVVGSIIDGGMPPTIDTFILTFYKIQNKLEPLNKLPFSVHCQGNNQLTVDRVG